MVVYPILVSQVSNTAHGTWFRDVKRVRWYCDALQIYRGHKPPKVSTVDWNHYLEFDQEGLIRLFKDDVTNKIDRALKTRLEKWKENRL